MRLKKASPKILQKIHDKLNLLDSKIEFITDEFQQERANQQNTAQTWLEVFDSILEEMNHLQASRFLPAKAQHFTQMRDMMRQNMAEGHFQTVIAQSQQLYSEGTQLLRELAPVCEEAARLETEIRHILQELKQSLASPQLQQRYSTTEGKMLEVDVDASFWAENSFNALVQRHAELQRQAAQSIGKGKVEELRSLQAEAQNALKQYQETVVEAVRRHFLHVASMDRQEEIAESLTRQGFEVIDNFFEQEDPRQSNVLLMENAAGERILVRVVPEMQGETVKVSFSSLNPVTHASRMRALNESIGVQPIEEPGYETRPAPPEDFDLQRYGRRKGPQHHG